jgi:hypothetical protein
LLVEHREFGIGGKLGVKDKCRFDPPPDLFPEGKKADHLVIGLLAFDVCGGITEIYPAFKRGFLQTPPHGDAPREQLGIFDLPSASTFVNMFNTLKGFTHRELSPHKFTPPGIGIFDVPGVDKSLQRMAYSPR